MQKHVLPTKCQEEKSGWNEHHPTISLQFHFDLLGCGIIYMPVIQKEIFINRSPIHQWHDQLPSCCSERQGRSLCCLTPDQMLLCVVWGLHMHLLIYRGNVLVTQW